MNISVESIEIIPVGFQTPPVLKAFERLLAENRQLKAELEQLKQLLETQKYVTEEELTV